MAAEDSHVRGTDQMKQQAEEGMKLFAKEGEAVLDVEAAAAFKEATDQKIAALEEEAKLLTGKDNKKLRQEKDKEKAALKVSKEYIDASKVLKGLQPPNGNFVKTASAPAPAATPAEAAPAEPAEPVAEKAPEKEKKKTEKKVESAGISKAERDELEKLKTQIIEKKKELKESGMTGGQINKEETIVAWVTRMNELKEKECPGSTTAGKGGDDKKSDKKKKKLDSETTKLLEEKQKAFEEYAEKLRTEFKYSKKEIAADPDYIDMKAEIDKLLK